MLGCSEALWKSRDPSVFGATEGTLGVAWKCFGVCMTLLGQPNPNHTRSVSQTRIFRKSVRYTFLVGFPSQKCNIHKNLQNPKSVYQFPRPSRHLLGVTPEFLDYLRGLSAPIFADFRSDHFGVSDVDKIGTNSRGNLTFSWWKPKICKKVFFVEFHSLSGARAYRPKCLAGRRLRNVFWFAHQPQILQIFRLITRFSMFFTN